MTDTALAYYEDSIMPDFEDLPDIRPVRARDATTARALRQYHYTIDKMKTRFYGGEEARDRMVNYLRNSDEVKKKRKCSVEEHVGRMTTLLNKTNDLPGHVQPELGPQQKIQILVKTFPVDW